VACPCPAARDSLYTPVRIVELDLDEPSGLRPPGGSGAVDPEGRVLALVRLHGHPLGLVNATGAPGDLAGLRRALVDAAHRELRVPARSDRTPAAMSPAPFTSPSGPANPARRATATSAARPGRAGRARMPADPPLISVIVATHDREGMLRQCLDSLLRNGYPRAEIIVVDNAPANDAARTLVRGRYAGRVRYLREPVAGLARAHNTGLAAARGELCAFTDDDTLADPAWLTSLAAAFAGDRRIGCVTGLILPAELETEAQAALENHGGFGKGFAARTWSLADRRHDPLFPFAAGQFGSGANMAFRTAELRGIGGFDPATGTGTPAHGGDDLLAFFRMLVAGHTLAYAPDALIWHRHRRTMDALPAQAFGYGAGFGAYLAAALTHEPAMLPALLRRLPRGLGLAAGRVRGRPAARGKPSLRLARLEIEGLVYGPVGYLRSVRRQRGTRTGSCL
jgi:GT2 family glycosyltransferase